MNLRIDLNDKVDSFFYLWNIKHSKSIKNSHQKYNLKISLRTLSQNYNKIMLNLLV